MIYSATRDCHYLDDEGEQRAASFKLCTDTDNNNEESIYISGQKVSVDQAVERIGEGQFYNCMSELASKICKDTENDKS